MVEKGIASSPELKKSKPEVLAIPVSNFAAMLAQGDEKGLGEIRVLPSPSTIKAIEELRSSAATDKTD